MASRIINADSLSYVACNTCFVQGNHNYLLRRETTIICCAIINFVAVHSQFQSPPLHPLHHPVGRWGPLLRDPLPRAMAPLTLLLYPHLSSLFCWLWQLCCVCTDREIILAWNFCVIGFCIDKVPRSLT